MSVEILPIERRLTGRKRFAHLLGSEGAAPREQIQATVDRGWAALRTRRAADAGADEKGVRA